MNPNEALGLLIYTIEVTNNFLKFREAWLSITRSTSIELSLAWPLMLLIDWLPTTLS